MIASMTGYGAAERVTEEVRVAVELRTLNNRYLKLHLRTPEGLTALEPVLEKAVRERITRGTVKLDLAVEPRGRAARAPVNAEVLAAYWNDVAAVCERLGAPAPGPEALLALPGVVGAETALAGDADTLPALVREAAAEALDSLDAMRAAEGEATVADMRRALEEIAAGLSEVEARAPEVVAEYHGRLQERMAQLLEGVEAPVDDPTLARELAYFAERADVNEEMSRLASHVDQFREMLGADGPVGRKLEFIAQEMYREVNTIGSKANDAAIGRTVVEMKVQVDRLREQTQNIE